MPAVTRPAGDRRTSPGRAVCRADDGQNAGRDRGRRHLARTRHRRQHRPLRLRRCRLPEDDPSSRSASARLPGASVGSGHVLELSVVRTVPGGDSLRGPHGLYDRPVSRRQRRRRRAADRAGRQRQLSRDAGSPAGAGARVRVGAGPRRIGRADRRDQRCLLGARVWPAARRGGPHHRRQRTACGDRRRHGAPFLRVRFAIAGRHHDAALPGWPGQSGILRRSRNLDEPAARGTVEARRHRGAGARRRRHRLPAVHERTRAAMGAPGPEHRPVPHGGSAAGGMGLGRTKRA